MEALFADLPTNAIAQDNLLLEKAAAVSALYSAFYKRRSQDSQEAIKAKLPSILGGAVGFVGDKMGNMMDMNETEIKKYARENNASYREYVLGVIQGTYKSPKRAMLDNQVEVLNNFSQQMYESRERSRQIEAERQATLKQIQQERHQRELEKIKITLLNTSPPGAEAPAATPVRIVPTTPRAQENVHIKIIRPMPEIPAVSSDGNRE